MLFFGTDEFAIPSLERLAEGRHAILACVTQPDRPQGRGLKRLPSPVKVAAQRLRVPVEEPEDIRRALPHWQQLRLDAGIVIAYGRLIPPELLTLPAHGMLGVHPSLLPKYRGASPIAWSLLQGDATTGVTVFRLSERLDAGDIARQREVDVAPAEDAVTLSNRLARLGAELLAQTVEELERGTAVFHPQDERLASDAPKLRKAQGHIDWRQSACAIDRLVRAMTPWPGAFTHWHGSLLKLWATSCRDQDRTATTPAPPQAGPGTIKAADARGIVVATGQGDLIIHELHVAGKRRMSAQEFLAGHAIHVGERLETHA